VATIADLYHPVYAIEASIGHSGSRGTLVSEMAASPVYQDGCAGSCLGMCTYIFYVQGKTMSPLAI
jgi:hypothetical protein